MGFFGQKSREWQDQLIEIRAQIERHGKAHCAYMSEGIKLLELLQRALERYQGCESQEKRRILNLVLSNSIWLNAQLIPKYRQSFDLLAAANGEIKKESPGTRAIGTEFEKWWSQGDSFRTVLVIWSRNSRNIEDLAGPRPYSRRNKIRLLRVS